MVNIFPLSETVFQLLKDSFQQGIVMVSTAEITMCYIILIRLLILALYLGFGLRSLKNFYHGGYIACRLFLWANFLFLVFRHFDTTSGSLVSCGIGCELANLLLFKFSAPAIHHQNNKMLSGYYSYKGVVTSPNSHTFILHQVMKTWKDQFTFK